MTSPSIRPFSGQTTPIVLSHSCIWDRWQPLVSPQGRWEGFHYMGVFLLLILMVWSSEIICVCWYMIKATDRQTLMQTQNPDPLTALWKHALSNLGQDKVEWLRKKAKRENRTQEKPWESAINSKKVQKTTCKSVITAIFYNLKKILIIFFEKIFKDI